MYQHKYGVSEKGQRGKIWGFYKHIELPSIEVLNIPDDYEFRNYKFVEKLTDRINDTVNIIFEI